MPHLSHVNFQIDIANEVIGRGYSVKVALPDNFRDIVHQRTKGQAEFLSLGAYTVSEEHVSKSTSSPGIAETTFLAGLEYARMNEALSGRLTDILKKQKPDLVLVDYVFVQAYHLASQLNIPAVVTYPNPADMAVFSYDVDRTLSGRARRLMYLIRTAVISIRLKLNGINRNDVHPDVLSKPLFGVHMSFAGYNFPFELSYPPTHAFVGFTRPELNETDYHPEDIELKKYLDDLPSDVDAVYVAISSIVEAEPKLLDVIVKGVLDSGDNIKIVLKWPDFQTLPHDWPHDRIQVEKWPHQLMVLQHNRVKLFVTHGDTASMSEAIISNTPVVVLPQFTDQTDNALLAMKAGFGVSITSPQDITIKAVERSINTILSNYSRFVSAVKNVDQLWKLAGGMKRAGDLVESVLVGGVNRFKPVDWDAPFWSINNLDLAGISLIILLTLMVSVYWLCRKCFQAVRSLFGFTDPKLKEQ